MKAASKQTIDITEIRYFVAIRQNKIIVNAIVNLIIYLACVLRFTVFYTTYDFLATHQLSNISS